MSSQTHDFIIVGAGTAGCLIASQLSRSAGKPKVLLLEAGGRNDNPHARIDSDRYVVLMAPGMNWNYKTAPQEGLDGRCVDYARGKGLGGSTAINFCLWNIGPRADFDELVRLTGDASWGWERCRARLDVLEDFHAPDKNAAEDIEKWCNPELEKHGKGGPLKIGFPDVWAEKNMMEMVDIWAQNGYKVGTDTGTGDVLNIAIYPSTAFKGYRTTAADLLSDPPENLTVVTDAQVHKVNFEGKRAVGVTTIDGKTYSASKEVILSGGSLDTPKVLMLSGIGPKDQLTKFSIPIIHANGNVGQNLMDHCHCAPTWQRKEEKSIRPAWFKNPSRREEALKQWEADRTGPLSEIQCMMAIGFMKSDAVYASAEFKALPEERKQHLNAPTTPTWETCLGGPCAEYLLDPMNTPAAEAMWIFLQNTESRGSAVLQSSDPREPLLFDPKMLTHPFDKRMAIEAMKELLKVAESDAFQKDTIKMLQGPKSDSEEDILAYWRQTAGSTWHMTGTCKMGKSEVEDEAVVDPDFKVFGVKGLRVADMSVVPIIANNHTMTTAYLTGMIAAEKIIAQYQLDA